MFYSIVCLVSSTKPKFLLRVFKGDEFCPFYCCFDIVDLKKPMSSSSFHQFLRKEDVPVPGVSASSSLFLMSFKKS